MGTVAILVLVIWFSYAISPKKEREQIKKDLKDIRDLLIKWIDRK